MFIQYILRVGRFTAEITKKNKTFIVWAYVCMCVCACYLYFDVTLGVMIMLSVPTNCTQVWRPNRGVFFYTHLTLLNG